MKFRILFLSVCAFALGTTGWYVYNGCSSEASTAYIPRSEFESAQGIKGAMEYYKLIKSNIYTGEIEPEDIVNVRNAVQEISRRPGAKDENLSWTSMGPTNVGGRTRGLITYPNEPNKILAGGISGGLFRSTNAGLSWTPLSGFQDAIGVSSIAILGNGHIYVATGHSREGNFNGDGGSEFMGSGLYVSTDDGASFNIVSDFQPTAWNEDDDWAWTNKIIADPNDPDRLWVGTNFGLYPYIDGDLELGSLPSGLFPYNTTDFVVSSSGKNIMVAAGIETYASTDFGATFTQVNNGPYTSTTATTRTIDFAVSASDEESFYASVAAPSGRLSGIYATQNAGQSWSVIAPSNLDGASPFAPFSTPLSRQGNYDNMITAVPTEPGEDFNVIMGGIVLYRWQSPASVTPGITLWEGINDNFATAPGGPPSPIYVHSDIHESTWSSDGTLYLGTDGGVFKSVNEGQTWSSVNFNYSTTQYYSIAFSPSGQTLGGLQDNGTLWLSLEAGSPGLAQQFTGGDGFDCAISQEFPDYMFSTLYNGEVFRSTDGGENVATLGNLMQVSGGGGDDFATDIALHENPWNEHSQIYVDYTPTIDSPYLQLFEDSIVVTASGDTIIGKIPAGTELMVDASNSPFMLSEVLDEDLYFYSYYVRTIDDTEFIYHNVGDTAFIQETPQFMMAAPLSNGVYITREPLKTNGVPRWHKLSEDTGTPTSVEFSPDGDHLYVGYGSGRLVRFSGLNNAWTATELDVDDTEVTKTILYNGSGAVTGIDVDYSMGQGTSPGAEPASGRVVISIGNYGGNGKIRVSDNAATTSSNSTFENIWNVDAGIIGMPCYSVVMDVSDPNKILAGTEYGIWYTDNNGDDWVNVNNGDMVRVPVFGLRQQKRPEWQVGNSGVVYAGTHGRGVFKSDYFFNAPNSVEDLYTAEIKPLSDLIIYPNPAADMATLKYTMGTSGKVNMHVFSLDGRLVDAKVGQPVEAGKDRLMTINVADLPTGTYLVQLTTEKESKTVKFVKSN